jgi:hypothetical protein
MLDERVRQLTAVNKIVKSNHVLDLEVSSIKLYYFNER